MDHPGVWRGSPGEMLRNMPAVKDGQMKPSQEPGIGISVDWEAVERLSRRRARPNGGQLRLTLRETHWLSVRGLRCGKRLLSGQVAGGELVCYGEDLQCLGVIRINATGCLAVAGWPRLLFPACIGEELRSAEKSRW